MAICLNQLDVKKQSLIRAHCSIVTVRQLLRCLKCFPILFVLTVSSKYSLVHGKSLSCTHLKLLLLLFYLTNKMIGNVVLRQKKTYQQSEWRNSFQSRKSLWEQKSNGVQDELTTTTQVPLCKPRPQSCTASQVCA
jgi:hypothetical protein